MAKAFLPAQLIYVAAQFASADASKKVLTAIHVRPAGEDGVIITSTDSHRMFQVTCPDATWYCDQPLLLDAKQFKKRIAYGRFIAIDDTAGNGEGARILGGKTATAFAEFLQSIPWASAHADLRCPDTNLRYPDTDQLWPDSFKNAPEAPIAFNAQLLGDFLQQVTRYSWNGVVAMQTNSPTNPLLFTSTIRDTYLEDVEMRFLLMPVQIRA
jgi:DNA polymerase III sliding clamp (beta) subunit (PCNA family)